jgi:hypothetical protein
VIGLTLPSLRRRGFTPGGDLFEAPRAAADDRNAHLEANDLERLGINPIDGRTV